MLAGLLEGGRGSLLALAGSIPASSPRCGGHGQEEDEVGEGPEAARHEEETEDFPPSYADVVGGEFSQVLETGETYV